METRSTAKVISYNLYGEKVCASAAKISTTKGTSYEIFENAQDDARNRQLIERVLSSGHKSLIEHAVFTIAMWNVSAYVEQFFIECRLASFTVKSRRYVDFGGLGYYIPPDLTGAALESYRRYMDLFFAGYRSMLENGVPKEDARFLLPYSFNSNFYCTINARELIHVIHAMRYGRGRGVPELRSLADQIVEQVGELFPTLLPELDSTHDDYRDSDFFEPVPSREDRVVFLDEEEAGAVELLQAPSQPEKVLKAAYRVSHPGEAEPADFSALLDAARPRELEQLCYTFAVSDITLSGITHIVRHRMQSIIIPPLQGINGHRYIMPATVKGSPALQKQYEEIFEQAAAMRREMEKDPLLARYAYYFILSGNVTDVITTMNARELAQFIQLRSCNRAQWEIRQISIRMLRQLRASLPEVFHGVGPACYRKGRCTEGRLSCGREKETAQFFGGLL